MERIPIRIDVCGEPPLTEALIRSHVEALKGKLVDPENNEMEATIAEVRKGGVALQLPRSVKLCPFQEIIHAEAVIRYWLARKST
jgi:hypothetical protein